MRSNKIKGTSGIEYFIVIVLLISFLIIGVVMASSVFHFAILPAGIISTGSGSPVPCNASIASINGKPNEFNVSVSDGSLGLIYKVYMNNVDSSHPNALELVGNYSVGTSDFFRQVTISDRSINTVVIANTTGSNVSIDGVKYTAGGQCEAEIFAT